MFGVQEAKNLPMVLNVHGGPWARDFWGYRPDVAWFTNRGYAVLQVSLQPRADHLAADAPTLQHTHVHRPLCTAHSVRCWLASLELWPLKSRSNS